jgi:RNA polymerase sigma-70 factor (ECF subfamily)
VESADDRRLIKDCLKGQTAAYGELVRRYQDRLFNTVYRVVGHTDDAQDVVQETFISAYQSLHTFKGDSQLFTWLYRIAMNAAITMKRKKKAVISLDTGSKHDLLIDPMDQSVDNQPGDSMERNEDEARLKDALAKLSAEHRAVVVMKDIDDMKYEEIAAILEIPIGTVRSRLHRARLELRELLEHKKETLHEPPSGDTPRPGKK